MAVEHLPCAKLNIRASASFQILFELLKVAMVSLRYDWAPREMGMIAALPGRTQGWGRHPAGWLSALIILVLVVVCSGSARADGLDKQPVQYSISPHGVNLQTGMFFYNSVDVEIGDLSLTRSWGNQSAMYRENLRLFGPANDSVNINFGWNHNFNEGTSIRLVGTDNVVSVVAGGKQYFFYTTSNGYFPKNHSSNGTYLRYSAEEFRFTDREGTEYYFSAHPGVSQNGASGKPHQVLRQAVRRDGTVWTYTYLPSGSLQEVRSSRGYSIHLDYNATGDIIAACGRNLAWTYVTASDPCGSGGLRATYSYTGTSLSSVTDIAGGVTSYQYGLKGPTCVSIINSSACAITNTYGSWGECSVKPRQIVRQVTATGDEWLYCYEPMPNAADEPVVLGRPRWSYTTMTEPNGVVHDLRYDRGRLVDHITPAGSTKYLYRTGVLIGQSNTNTYSFEMTDTRPVIVTHPGGNSDYYLYNTRGSVIFFQKAPAGATEPATYMNGQPIVYNDPSLMECCVPIDDNILGPPSSLTVGTAYLPDYGYTGCGVGPADAKRCDQPIARIDPKGNQTDYTYDQAHGGVLTETGPAVNGGIRPQIRYGYVQRYARIKDANGNFVASGSPIWLPAWRAQCRKSSAGSSGGCSLAGDEVVTNYEYGPDTGPNNLLLRGQVISADGVSLRTCYTYDAQGHQVSKTLPNANLSSCP